jgi:hypothetical protein
MITKAHRNMLLVADRTRDLDVIAVVIDHVLAESRATLLDIEMCFRDAAALTYLVANGDHPKIVLQMPAMLKALDELGITPEQNRAALGATTRD